jgi:hypothetical protein
MYMYMYWIRVKWDLSEKEDERMGVCLRRPWGGEKNRQGRRQN